MDRTTLGAYDRDAKIFADEWAAQPAPTDLHATVRRFFAVGPTADIGCGSGRDAAWLNANGYPTEGFDGSDGLLAEARKRHPDVKFSKSLLPGLSGIRDGSFTNVLCETVIMHLQPNVIAQAVSRLLAILVPAGVLYLGWRVTPLEDRRDDHGRLYAAFDPQLALDALVGETILLDEEAGSISSGKLIRRVVAQKLPPTAK